MLNTVTMVDPDMGWKYGFPKPLPKDIENEDITEWLVENGYPREVIENWKQSELGYLPCRFWEEEVDEQDKKTSDLS